MKMLPLYRCIKKGKNPIHELLPVCALVDDCVFETVSAIRWFMNKKGYVRSKARLNGKTINYALSVEVMRAYGEECPSPSHTVDHISRDKLDNRRANLRWASPQQQLLNREIKGRDGMPKGVVLRPSGRYAAQMSFKEYGARKHIHLGTFNTREEASRAFQAAWNAKYEVVAKLGGYLYLS